MLGFARSSFARFAPTALLPATLACGSSVTSAPSDAGLSDAGLSDAGSPVTASDASPSPDAASQAALVAQCEALARNFQTRCAGSDPRPCLWGAYAQLCATGQTQLLVDSMNCLDSTTCRSFSDSNGGAACLASVHASGETTEAKTFLQNECTVCGGTCPLPVGTAEVFPYLTDADLASLSTCSTALCTYFTDADAGGNACPPNADFALFSACQ